MESDLLLKLGYNVLAILIPALVALGIELIRRKLGVEKMHQVQKELEAKQDLALLAVRFVEQVYTDVKGPEKYNLAASWLADRAEERGIRITDDEIKGLVESALRMLKDEFGEQWTTALET